MFKANINNETKQNENFRKVLYTGDHAQLVLMNVPVGEEIGEETHKVDQLLFFIEGVGELISSGVIKDVEVHDVIFVPAGTPHNFRNTGDVDLKLFTVYAPPQHKSGTVHKTKVEAIKEETFKDLEVNTFPIEPYENM